MVIILLLLPLVTIKINNNKIAFYSKVDHP